MPLNPMPVIECGYHFTEKAIESTNHRGFCELNDCRLISGANFIGLKMRLLQKNHEKIGEGLTDKVIK